MQMNMKVMYLCNIASLPYPNILSLLSSFSLCNMCPKLPAYIFALCCMGRTPYLGHAWVGSCGGQSGLIKAGAGEGVCLLAAHLAQAVFWVSEAF